MIESEFTTALMSAEPGSDRWEEFKAWGACTDEELIRLRENVRAETLYLGFFAGLKESQLRRLVGRTRDREIFAQLAELANREQFRRQCQELGLTLPEGMERFERFLDERVALRPLRQRIVSTHGAAVEQLSALMGGRPVQAALAAADPAFRQQLRALGFRFDDQEWKMVTAEADAAEAAQRLEDLLANTAFKQRFAIEYGVKDINKVSASMLFKRLSSKAGTRWLLRTVAELGLDLDYDARKISEISRRQVTVERLAEVETAVSAMGMGHGPLGLSSRVVWLIAVSLLVCVVGVANAMLMSVTERFKEIATMKCLGATDGFIMINFLLESGLQGFVGGTIGGTLGFALGVARAAMNYGLMAARSIPCLTLGGVFLGCLGVGVILSVVAAIYPAWVAARLAPMEAMRVE
ncbi:MAG: ABC transporter permease [Kiritimatiellia bacterium]